ncbi:hypothetical protein PHYBOEH_009678 [Phytophthora boehmeriae]|uniref:Sugar phosphate transporter domain-containing protein n=1 Tax=Phytophthora boehmeriae TaxID=109152 RepID=A0A8T1X6B5_9STRA|nr:hypothetical protein PHYBOEH_009678 [Phytophthora boehmeriae]
METPRPTLLSAIWPCVFYLLCSLAMNLLTKTLVTSFQWHSVYTLGAIQSTFTLATLLFLAAARRFVAFAMGSKQVSTVEKQEAAVRTGSYWSYALRVLLPLMFLNLCNMLLGFASLRVVNLPMYLVIRRLTTITVMLIEWLVLRKTISNSVKGALLVSTAGSLIAGSTDMVSDVRGGYSLVLMQNLCTAMSLAFSKESALSPRQLVLINSTAGAVCCSVLGFLFERDEVAAFPHLNDPRFVIGMGLLCSMCVLYQFSLQLCTLRTSALTTTVTGNIKDLFATVGGYLLFPDAPLRTANILGVALSFIGSYSFSYIRYRALVHQKTI